MPFTSQIARLNSAVALERLGGDEELLREVARLFLEEYPVLLLEIRQAVAAQDAEALQRAAHSLMGRTLDLAHVERGLAELDEALQYIHPALLELALESA